MRVKVLSTVSDLFIEVGTHGDIHVQQDNGATDGDDTIVFWPEHEEAIVSAIRNACAIARKMQDDA